MAKVERTCGFCGKIFQVWPSKIKYGGGKFCGCLCVAQSFHIRPRLFIEDKFWEHVDKSPNAKGCWIWTGWVNDGYGRLHVNKKVVFAHRVSYELAKGPIPKGLLVTHSCDNPSCVNPSHLGVDTHAGNTEDAVRRGRIAHKLSAQDALEIRALCAGGKTQREIAKKFNVSQTLIFYIVHDRAWKHV